MHHHATRLSWKSRHPGAVSRPSISTSTWWALQSRWTLEEERGPRGDWRAEVMRLSWPCIAARWRRHRWRRCRRRQRRCRRAAWRSAAGGRAPPCPTAPSSPTCGTAGPRTTARTGSTSPPPPFPSPPLGGCSLQSATRRRRRLCGWSRRCERLATGRRVCWVERAH